jgi:hypothetical protein
MLVSSRSHLAVTLAVPPSECRVIIALAGEHRDREQWTNDANWALRPKRRAL